MTIDDKITDEKLQYNIKKEPAQISTLSSGKIDKYEYLTGVKILPPDQRRAIEQTNYIYSPLEKAYEKQIKRIEHAAEKQTKYLQTLKTDQRLKSVGDLFSKVMFNCRWIRKNYKDRKTNLQRRFNL